MKIFHLWIIIKAGILILVTEDVKSLKIQLFNLLGLVSHWHLQNRKSDH